MSEQGYCGDCGCKVFNLGCVNCDEEHYIEEQSIFTDLPEVYATHSEHMEDARFPAP